MQKQQKNILDFAADVDFSEVLTNPILDIAARLWENDRYEAFKICYRSMRVIDDLVDDRKVLAEKLDDREKATLRKSLEEWYEALAANCPQDRFQENLLEVINHFKIPLWPWGRLCRAMVYDLYSDSFPTFLSFLRYTEGAAIAPASIFTHLCGVYKVENEFQPPRYDIRLAARTLAIFSYLVHIMRDFEKDQRAGLNYFALDLLRRYDLTESDLASPDAASRPSKTLRQLFQIYHTLADRYRGIALTDVERHLEFMAPRYQFSLKMIYALYLQIFERIDPLAGRFTQSALNPAPEEVQAAIDRTISSFVTPI